MNFKCGVGVSSNLFAFFLKLKKKNFTFIIEYKISTAHGFSF